MKTFETVALEVLALKKMKAAETRAAATRQITRLIENFGPRPISEITGARWAEYVVREQEKKKRTFFDDRKYMRMILIYAVNEGLIIRRIPLPIPDLPTDAGRELEHAELEALMNVAGYTLRFQIEIALFMGLRLREMLKLRRPDAPLTEEPGGIVDMKNGVVNLRPRDTKTRRARVVPIPPILMPKFSAWLAVHTALWLFLAPGGEKPMNNNKTAWRRCKRMAHVTARWHDLRHTCATRMLRSGVPFHTVAKYLGMSPKVLNRIYAHLSIADLREAANSTTNQKRLDVSPKPFAKVTKIG